MELFQWMQPVMNYKKMLLQTTPRFDEQDLKTDPDNIMLNQCTWTNHIQHEGQNICFPTEIF